MAAITAALVSAALSGAGSYFGNKSAKRAAKKEKKKLIKATRIARDVQGTALSQKEAAVRRAAEKQLGGLSTAQTDINRALRERENVTQGQLSQELARSGLGSTTIGANARRAVAGDTSRTLSDLMSQLAQARSGIEAGREQQLGDIALQRGDLFSQLAQQEIMAPSFQGESAGEMITGALGAGLGAYAGAGGMGNLNLFGQQPQQAAQMNLLEQIYGGGSRRSRLGGQPIPPSFGGFY